jgi:hypothetical protein
VTDVFRADVEWNANIGEFKSLSAEVREDWQRTTGAMSDGSLRAAVAQEKLERSIKRNGAESTAAKAATLRYREEMRALATTSNQATVATRRHESALLAEERALGRFSRGALAAVGISSELKRALLLGSGSFLIGAGAAEALKQVIDAAKEQEVAQGQLQVALRNSGQSWLANKTAIDEALAAQVKTTAFTDNELTTSLAGFVRRFGDVNQALRANALAANVARQQNISLADAAQLVTRASFGNPRALKALGIELVAVTANTDKLKATTKNASLEQLRAAAAADKQATELAALDAINAKFHGAAARYLTTSAGKQALFNAELDRSKEIIGAALLPELNKLLGSLSTWLERMNESGKLQRDVNKAVRETGEIIHGVEAVLSPFVETFRDLGHAVGGTKNEVELLGAAFILLKIRAKAAALTTVAAEVGGIGAAATTATSEVGLLGSALLGLPAAAAAAAAAILTIPGAQGQPPKSDPHLGQYPGSKTPFLDEISHDFNFPTGYSQQQIDTYEAYRKGKLTAAQAEAALEGKRTATERAPHFFGGTPASRTKAGAGAGGNVPPPVLGLTYTQQNALLEAQATKSTADDRRILTGELGILNKALTQKGLTPEQRNQLLSERNGVLSQIDAIDSANAQLAAEAKRKADASRKKTIAALEQAPAGLRLELERAVQRHAPPAQIAAILTREKAAILKQIPEIERLGGGKADVLKAREHITALDKKIAEAFEEAPIALRIQEQTARAKGASDEKLLSILRAEHAALEKQIAQLQKIGASKDAILKARTNEAEIQKRIDTITKKKTTDGRSVQADFLTHFQDIVGKYAPNAFGLPLPTGKTNTHLYDLVHETRRSNQILTGIAGQSKFPASHYAHEAAMSASG